MALDPTNFTELVEQFVRGSIRRPTDTLGVRRTDISFTDIQEAAAGTFLLYPQAPFYVLFLSCQRVQELIVAEEEIILELLDLILSTGRTVNPIKDLSPLSNITSALLELESAIGARSQAFTDIEQVSAFKRFDSNVNRFLDAYGRNVKDGGSLVDTPQGARAKIPQLVESLKESHDEIVRRVTLIRQGLTNFEAVNLPAISAAGVISRSRAVIQSRTSSLSAATQDGRLSQNLDTVQELLAARALVRRYGSLSRPTSVFSGDITATPYSDPDLPASSGSISATKSIHNVVDGKNKLDFFLDGPATFKFQGTVTSVLRNGLFEARVTKTGGDFPASGIVPGDILYFLSGPNNKTRWVVNNVDLEELELSGTVEVVPGGVTNIEIWRNPDESIQVPNCVSVEIQGLGIMEGVLFSRGYNGHQDTWRLAFGFNGSYEVLTNFINNSQVEVGWDGDIHAGQLCESLNTQWDALVTPRPGRWEPFFPVPGYQGEIVITSLGGGVYRATLASGNLDSVGVQSTGWYVKIMTGPDKYDFYRIVNVDGSAPKTFVDFDVPAGSVDITNSQILQIGRSPRIRLIANDQYLANSTPYTLSINSPSIEDTDAARAMGLFVGRTITGAPLRARTAAEAINAEGVKVSCSVRFDSIVSCNARTNPLSPTTLTLYKVRGTASVVSVGGTCTFALPDADHAQVEVGDWAVYRTSNPINTVHQVTGKTDTTITTTGPAIPSGNLEVEIGDLSIPSSNQPYTIVIPSGSNAGEYAVQSRGETILDFIVSPQLPQRQDIGKDPVFTTAQLGLDFPVFSSKNQTVNSSIIVHGSAGLEFFSSVPTAQGLGTTPFLSLTAIPTGLQAGDVFEYYPTDYRTPSETRTIVSVDFTNKRIEVDPETPSNRTYSISQSIPPPFALLRVAQLLSTNGLEGKLQTWLDRPENGSAYFTDLNRFINPLLVNENPTAVQVSDAQDRVKDLYEFLTITGASLVSGNVTLSLESILDGYSVAPQSEIDTLLNSFKEKGADRAVDILLESNFVGFFGVDVDTSSYAGSMLKQLRDLAREDLPMRKVDRLETQQSQVISSSEEEDFEFTGSDVEGSGSVPTG